MLALRDYQQEAIATIVREASAGVRRQLVQIPTGGGKTVIAAELSRRARKRVLMVVHRDELVQQSVEKFGWVWPGEHVGVVKGSSDEHDRRVVVASVQTLAARGRLDRMDVESFGLVIVDEAHHVAAESWLYVLGRLGVFPEAPAGRLLLGITATPSRSDGVGLGHVFEKLVFRKSLADLIGAGYLKDVTGVRVETHLDLSRVRISSGDFNTKDLSLAVDTDNRNRLLCEAYERYGEERKALVFTADITHAQHVAEALRERGHKADWVSGELPSRERQRRLAAFRDGDTSIMASAMLLTEGYDEPSIGCVIMARPTRSQTLFMQAVGRGLRLYPGLDDCIVLDLADTRQDLVGLGDLEGIRELTERRARAKAESVPGEGTRDVVDDDHLDSARLVATPLDLLARSAFRWHIEAKRRMRLEAGPGEDVVLLRQETGLWEVVLQSRGRRLRLVEQALPLDYAQARAEEHIRQNGLEGFAGKDARWRTRPATERQVELLEHLGVEAAGGLTREAAQDRIRSALRDKTLKDPDAPWRQQPASEAQLEWMRKRHIPVKDGVTKGDVAAMMEKLKTRKRAAQ